MRLSFVTSRVPWIVDLVVNPDVVRAQIESGIIYGLSMMTEKIEFVDGVVQQQGLTVSNDAYVEHRRFTRYSCLQTIHLPV